MLAAVLLTGCGASPPPAAVPEAAAEVKDHTRMLPLTGRTGASTTPAPLFGIPKIPGGTVGDYAVGGKKYRLFIVEAETSQKAAFLLLDAKAVLKDPEYLAHMGGYYGVRGTEPFYVFAKQQYLAGVSGLLKDDADPIARDLAARLR